MLKINLDLPVLYLWSGNYIKEDNKNWITRFQKSSYQTKIIIMVEGEAFISVNNKNYKLSAGDCLAIPPFYKMQGTKFSQSKVKFFWLQFIANTEMITADDPILISSIHQIYQHKFPTNANNYALLPEKFRIVNTNRIYSLFLNLISVAREKEYSERGRDFLTSFLLIELCNDFLCNLNKPASKSIARIQEIIEWINANISSEMNVQTIAEHFAINSSYLSRLFKKTIGIGIKRYLISAKLDYAKYLLLTTNFQVNQVALKSGFTDAKLFDHSFKKYNHISPTSYRKIFSYTHLTSPQNDPKPAIPNEYCTQAVQNLIEQILQKDSD